MEPKSSWGRSVPSTARVGEQNNIKVKGIPSIPSCPLHPAFRCFHQSWPLVLAAGVRTLPAYRTLSFRERLLSTTPRGLHSKTATNTYSMLSSAGWPVNPRGKRYHRGIMSHALTLRAVLFHLVLTIHMICRCGNGSLTRPFGVRLWTAARRGGRPSYWA